MLKDDISDYLDYKMEPGVKTRLGEEFIYQCEASSTRRAGDISAITTRFIVPVRLH